MMKRIETSNSSNTPNFIGSWILKDTDMCDEIVNFFEANPTDQGAGAIGGGVDESQKKTTDIPIKPKQLEQEKYKIFNTYIKNVVNCFNDYKEQWPFLNTIKGMEIGTFNLQKYSPGGHFSAVHTERGSSSTMHRVLAFMTYLNDVEEGGETEFLHFSKRVQPKTGRIVIWPAGFPYVHRGNPPLSGKKYILTSWMMLR